MQFFHESKELVKTQRCSSECSNCFYSGIAIACWYWREMTTYHIVENFADWWKKKIYVDKVLQLVRY